MKKITRLTLSLLAAGLTLTTSAADRQATPAASLKILDGFKVELLRSAQPGEGSWVAMTVDPKGRLIVSPQGGEPLLRITLDAQGQVAKMEKIELPPRGAMGLLCAFDALYVNGKGPGGLGLYRLTDTNDDDQYDKVELLRSWKGDGGEHGPHGVVLGPDKNLYVVAGNFVKVPTDILPTSQHKNYADDLVLPRAEDGNGFGAGTKPPGGFVVRMDKDGKNCELFGSGQRNTYDIAFNADGELFGFDSDMEWDWGTPWYRPIRAFHVTSGADHGYREGNGKWPEHYQDSLPATSIIGIGCPTGVAFGTGAKFPAKYQRAFYMMDWTYGRLIAVHLKPDGASYAGGWESFLSGKPLNLTDLEIGKDGAMYFLTGGRGTQAGLYRVSYTGPEVKEQLPVDQNAIAARKIRHQLETFHGKADPKAIATAWPCLGLSDRYLRYAARLAVESQPVAEWKDKALAETDPNAGLTALLALVRVGGKESQDAALLALKRFPMESLSEEQQLLKLRVVEVSLSRHGKPSPEVVTRAVTKLGEIYPNKSVNLNRELCQILVALEAPDVVPKTLGLIAKAATQEEQLVYLFALRGLKTGWTTADRKAYFSWFNNKPDADASVALVKNNKHTAETEKWFTDVGRGFGNGSSYGGFISKLKSAAIASLSDNERGELAAVLTGRPAVTAPVKPTPRKLVKEWKLADLEGSLDQAGKGRDFAKGKAAFLDAQCLACHRFGNEGGAVGADLTAVSSRFSRADVLSSIIEPSKVVSEQYQQHSFTLKNGDDLVGRVLEDTAEKYVVLVNALAGTKQDVRKTDVTKRDPSKLSSMPEGLVNVLTKEEILDLLAYIESGGKATAPAFAK